LTTTVNAPLELHTVVPATRLGSSQYSVMLSFGKKSWPVTVIPTLGPPAVGSSPIVALTGVGVGDGVGVGAGVGVGEGAGAWGVAVCGVLGGPVPAELVAVTVKVYVVPLVSPVMVADVVIASFVAAPGLLVTVYLLMVAPPLLAGAVQVRAT
jgi:hypothetical protein